MDGLIKRGGFTQQEVVDEIESGSEKGQYMLFNLNQLMALIVTLGSGAAVASVFSGAFVTLP